MTRNNYMGKIDEDWSGTTIPNYDSPTKEKPTKSQPNISEVMKEARKWLEENEFISYRVDGATDEIWEADQLVVNRLVYLINKAIKEAFERTRPKEVKYNRDFDDINIVEGFNDCLSELKSNEEEYLK
jgi:hypothetical protein